ncbi:hypothetical protein Tco_0464939 [Tanacetum coccineum]
MFVDDGRKPLYNVDYTGNADSDSEMEEHVGTMEKKNKRLMTDYDPYDDDLYESHDMSENLQAICDDFDITVRASYAKLFTGERSRKSVNFGTLVTPAENMADVAIPLEYIRAISKRFVNTAYDFFLGKWVAYPVVANYVRNTWCEDDLNVIDIKLGTPLMLDSFTSDMCMQSWDKSNYARETIELRDNVKLKDTIVVAMPKLGGGGFYTCTIHVRTSVLKNIGSDVTKNLKKPSGNKKKDAESRKEVSNPNPFEVLNSVENDVDLGTNGGTSNLASKEANSSGSSFWNVGSSSSTTTTPIVKKHDKLERLLIDGKFTLVDGEGKSLKKVDYSGDHDRNSKLAEKGGNSGMVSSAYGISSGAFVEAAKKVNSPFNANSDSEVEEMLNETAETYVEDPYDDDGFEDDGFEDDG